MSKYICINDLEVGKSYQHYRNRRFTVTVTDRVDTPRGLYLILKHPWIEELQVCLARTYSSSRWAEIKA